MSIDPEDPTVPLVAPPSLPTNLEDFLDVAGHRTRIFRAGQGPPLILVPSAFLRASSYKGTIEALSADFHVIAAEIPGSGGSARVEKPWGFDDGADWTVALIAALGLDRAIVLGHSDSGGMAAVLGARHPGWLRGLVLADSVGAEPGATWWKLALRRMRDGTFEEPRLNLPLTPHMLAGLIKHPRNWLDHAFKLAADTQPLEVAPQIAVPTLLAWGRRDHTFPPECAERFHAAIPNSRIAWHPASHDWLITHPADFADAVVRFARELG